MTFQISQRGKECLKAAQTLLRAGQTMTDSAIVDQLKALANDYQRQAEKVSHVDAVKAFIAIVADGRLGYRAAAGREGMAGAMLG